MSLELVFVAVAAVFGPMLLIVALIVRSAGPMTAGPRRRRARQPCIPKTACAGRPSTMRPTARKPTGAIGARLRVPDGRTEA